MKFLIVDDSSTMRKIVALALKAGGYEYTEADSAEKALETVKGEKFGFLIVDVNMPGMNGIDLVKELRKMPNYSNTPIIILTTESESSLKEEGRKAGANGWITKPFQKEALLETIKTLL